MRHLPLYLLLTAAAGCALPALASSEAVPDDAPAAVGAATAAEVKVAITGASTWLLIEGARSSLNFPWPARS